MEEAENFGLGEDIWEDAKVDTESLETIKVHL